MVRTMTIDDYDNVYALWLATPGMGMNAVDDSRKGIAKYLRRNPETCFVAENSGKIVGAVLSGHDGRRGYIYHLAVHLEHREEGIGSALLGRVIDALRNEGIRKVALVVFEHNEIGNAFWERHGFFPRTDLVYRNLEITGQEHLLIK